MDLQRARQPTQRAEEQAQRAEEEAQQEQEEEQAAQFQAMARRETQNVQARLEQLEGEGVILGSRAHELHQLRRAHDIRRQRRQARADQATQLGQLNVPAREGHAPTSIQQQSFSANAPARQPGVERTVTEAFAQFGLTEMAAARVNSRSQRETDANGLNLSRLMHIDPMPGQEQQMVVQREASHDPNALGQNFHRQGSGVASMGAEMRRQAQLFSSNSSQHAPGQEDANRSRQFQEEPAGEGLANTFSSLGHSRNAIPSSLTNGRPLMNSLDGFDDMDLEQYPSYGSRSVNVRLPQVHPPNGRLSPEPLPFAGPSYSTNGRPLHAFDDNAPWDIETSSETEDLARQSRGRNSDASLISNSPIRDNMGLFARLIHHLQSFSRISLLTDDISCRGDGEVTRMGAGESYRPTARPRSPNRTDSFRGDRERDRSPRRERARTPPTDSWHPGDRDRSPRRRSRTPPRRDRSPLRDNWRARPRSPIRGRTPPRRFSPRRDEDRRPRSPVRRDDRSVL